MADLRVGVRCRPEAALAWGKLTRVGNGGQPTYRKSLCLGRERTSMRCNECEPARHDCEPRINNVGPGAINVGLGHTLESMIVGQNGCSIASRACHECEPHGRHEVA